MKMIVGSVASGPPDVVAATTLLAALRVRYADADGWAVLSEVRDRTGLSSSRDRNRYADFLAMGTWASRGFEIEGFEVKASRSDWTKELKDPGKAEPIFRSCDRWWLAASPGVVADASEIPGPWGWMEWHPKRGELRVRKPAPKLDPTEPTRAFLASLLRSLARQEGAETRVAAAEKSAATRGFESGRAAERAIWERRLAADPGGDATPGGLLQARDDAREIVRLRAVEESLRKFEKRAGVRCDGWHAAEDVRDALALARAIGKRYSSAPDLLREVARDALRARRALLGLGGPVLRGLTLIRPWSWAIAAAGKRVENRTWTPFPRTFPTGSWIAIHAGQKWDARGAAAIATLLSAEMPEGARIPTVDDDPPGRIIAVARFVGLALSAKSVADWTPGQEAWFCGPVGWLLDPVVPLSRPVPCRGSQGLWPIPYGVDTGEIMERIGR